MEIFKQYEQNGMSVTEYTKDGGVTVTTVKTPIPVEPTEPVIPQPTIEEIAKANLLETQYQTTLIEMLAGF